MFFALLASIAEVDELLNRYHINAMPVTNAGRLVGIVTRQLVGRALGHGLLTYALVEEGLKSPAADVAPQDGEVLLREWLDYASRRVPQMQQTAMIEARKVGREVAFVEGETKIKEVEPWSRIPERRYVLAPLNQ
jgi:CBS domain-containing protein